MKATFDLYLPSLMSMLGFASNCETDEEKREVWRKFSQAVVYANAKYLPHQVYPEDN
ncbi:MAG: hypothetical protein QNJ55_27360 [Xenococcus sp. MO_188.B8]|nr:hypothetical protein [Xenococcus sp. MO_188.B8]